MNNNPGKASNRVIIFNDEVIQCMHLDWLRFILTSYFVNLYQIKDSDHEKSYFPQFALYACAALDLYFLAIRPEPYVHRFNE